MKVKTENFETRDLSGSFESGTLNNANFSQVNTEKQKTTFLNKRTLVLYRRKKCL